MLLANVNKYVVLSETWPSILPTFQPVAVK